jgi:hypothetical protein
MNYNLEWRELIVIGLKFRPRLVLKIFCFCSSHRILERMHGALNIDEKKLIAQLGNKSRDEIFKPN